MYFSSFSTIKYPTSDGNYILRDITKNVRIFGSLLDKITQFDTYIIKDGETPDTLAEKFYGDPNLEWLIMISNGKYNYLEDYPRPYSELKKYIQAVHGDKANDIVAYVKNGYIVDADTPGAIAYTNASVEELLNEKKRIINIIPSQYVQQILQEFESIING